MSGDFESFDWRSFAENTTALIAERWMLITPGVPGRWNTMTASWGGFGQLWGIDVAFAFVRPSRHTFGFMEREEGFTLSFFDEGHRSVLELCGARSGRDVDKAAEAGIRPRPFPSSGVAQRVGFEEARLVVCCRKIYAQDLDPSAFLDPSIAGNYPRGDVHRLYVGAVESAWRKPGTMGPAAR